MVLASEAARTSVHGWPTAAHPCHELRACRGPSCSSTAPLSGKGAGVGRGESTHLKGTEPAQTQPLELLLHQLGICYPPPPKRALMATEQRGKPRLIPALAWGSSPSPSISNPTSYQGYLFSGCFYGFSLFFSPSFSFFPCGLMISIVVCLYSFPSCLGKIPFTL